MLTRLVIHDVVLIEKLALPLERGLNVFTGETGAGKSILLDALALALGERSEAGLVRSGAVQASVAAEFHLKDDHAIFALAEEQGLGKENPVVLRRVIGKDGKSRAFFNDQPIGVGLLKQFGERLLEIHGQFETHGLLNAVTHRGFLDAFGGLDALRHKTGCAFSEWQEAAKALQSAKANRIRARAEEDFLRSAVAELEELAPQQGEADKLAAERAQLQHREKILEALSIAEMALDGERGANAALSQAGKAVSKVSDKAPALAELLAAIDRAMNESSEASAQLGRIMSQLDAQPDSLQKIEERLFALRAAARKHNAPVDALPDVLRDLQARLNLLEDESGRISKLTDTTDKARQAYVKLAEELSAKRQAAASRIEKAIARELPPLKLEHATFKVDIAHLSPEQYAKEGIDKITFLAATNIGSAPGALQKIASGGELARFMLALKTVLAAADPVPVLVFDEVDAGIGGAAASAVGERLAKLAKDVQILVVTHSPQVAARGTNHLRVSKRAEGKRTVTDVDILGAKARREEIARMLAGAHVTDAARKAADSLLQEKPFKAKAVEKKNKKQALT